MKRTVSVVIPAIGAVALLLGCSASESVKDMTSSNTDAVAPGNGAMMLTATSMVVEDTQNIELPSALDNTVFRLSEHRGKTVVLHFLLKTECPYCLRYTREYAKLAAASPDVIHLFVKPDSIAEIKEWANHLDKKELEKLPNIYRDADAKLAKRFQIPDGYAFHGQKVHYPALVALDGQGQELFRYVGKSNSDRMKISDFEKMLSAKKAR